jgi:hypothetical protein
MDGQSCFSARRADRATGRATGFLKVTLAIFAFVSLVLVPLGVAQALGGSISGVVLDRNQAPLENAQGTVRGTRLGSQTDANGRFRIGGVAGSTASL